MPSPVRPTRSEVVRAQLSHPVIDADGHYIEYPAALASFLRDEGIDDLRALFGRIGAGFGSTDYDLLTDAQRAERRSVRGPWWSLPAANTLDAATGVAANAADVSQRASANRERAESEVKQVEKSVEIITEMGGTAGEVAKSSADQKEAADKSSLTVESLMKSMEDVAASAASQNEEVTRATGRVSEMGETGSLCLHWRV